MRDLVDLALLLFFLSLNGTFTALIVLSWVEMLKQNAARVPELDATLMAEPSTPPISVIVPAFNEQANIVDSVRAILQLEYPELQVIVVNDGSTDQTLEVLSARFQLAPLDLVVRQAVPCRPARGIYQSVLDPRLCVVDKDNGGKADALNAGLNAARTPLVCCVDSDTIIERRALLRMVEPFLFDEQRTVAVGGAVRLANGCVVKDGLVQSVGLPSSWLARFQLIEYLRAFLFGRMGLNALGGPLVISGAFGLFLRDAVLAVGGYRDDTVGEDMELVVRLHRALREQKRPYRISYIPHPICYTEVPEDAATLGRQRDRWQRGLLDTVRRHAAMSFNPRYGLTGLLVLPMTLLFDVLGPFVELFGYGWFLAGAVTGTLDPAFAVLFSGVALLWGFLLSVQALTLDGAVGGGFERGSSRVKLIAMALLENLGYRQLTLFFRLRGALRYLWGERSWGKMQRKGFEAKPAPTETPR